MNPVHTKQLLVYFLLASYCSSVCVRERQHIMVVNQPNSQPLNLKFRLWLFTELIYMLLMSPPRCAISLEAETTSLFSMFRETRC